MVDSVAIHCFIAQHLAESLLLPVSSTTTFSVMLGDGSRVRVAGICNNVELYVASEVFYVNCYIFPLKNIDVILGISRLATLGDVKANWKQLTMEFKHNTHTVQLRGDPSLTCCACTATDLHTLSTEDECWFLLALEGPTSAASFGLEPSLLATHRQQIHGVIEAFPSVTTTDTTLPPHRLMDHRITLHPGALPISVRPYRYNHLQKDEMERLVSEMIAAGVIQASTSPFQTSILSQ